MSARLSQRSRGAPVFRRDSWRTTSTTRTDCSKPRFAHSRRTLAVRVRARLALARTPRGRVQAVIDTNLAPEEFDKRTGTAWLAFWGQVLHVRGLKRVQTAYQRRMLSNLRNDLRRMISGEDARSLAAMIAAMIDGVWLRAALSEWQEADSESARALLTAFVEGG